MSREIKFRCWYGEKMIKVGAIEFFVDGTHRVNDELWIFDPNTIMQSTELRDKNGKEIYEGDIVTATFVELHTVTGEVLWDQDRFIVKGAGVGLASFAPQGITEVIGNIWEHPHLLKSEPDAQVSDTTKMSNERDDGQQ